MERDLQTVWMSTGEMQHSPNEPRGQVNAFTAEAKSAVVKDAANFIFERNRFAKFTWKF